MIGYGLTQAWFLSSSVCWNWNSTFSLCLFLSFMGWGETESTWYDECGSVSEMSGRGNQSTWRKPVPVPFCPLQIPHDLTKARTWAATVGNWHLMALALGLTHPPVQWLLGGYFPGCKGAGARSGPLNLCLMLRSRVADLYLHSFPCLHGMTHNQLSTWTTFPYTACLGLNSYHGWSVHITIMSIFSQNM
jgi:hypothetical protein